MPPWSGRGNKYERGVICVLARGPSLARYQKDVVGGRTNLGGWTPPRLPSALSPRHPQSRSLTNHSDLGR